MTRNEIVVGLDDSRSAQAALRLAAEQARLSGATLRAIHVMPGPVDTTGAGIGAAGFAGLTEIAYVNSDQIEAEYRAEVTAAFDAVQPRPDWVLQFAEGDAGHVLVHQSAQATMLVLGTREHVGLGRIMAGSVSHYCLSHATCPVLAVPVAPVPRRPARGHAKRSEAHAGR